MGVSGRVEVRAGVAVEVGDWMGATAAAVAATGVIVGVGSGTTRAALVGAVGAGRGVSVGAGAGASVESSPQAETASTIIAVNARATGLMCASQFSLGAGRSPQPACSLTRRMSLSRLSLPRSYIRTSQRKVRKSVRLGPPDLTKSRTFTLRFKSTLWEWASSQYATDTSVLRRSLLALTTSFQAQLIGVTVAHGCQPRRQTARELIARQPQPGELRQIT